MQTWTKNAQLTHVIASSINNCLKVKGAYSSSWDESHHRATGCHLPHGITQCHLPPDTSERTPPEPQPVSWYSIYLLQKDGRLSWPRLPGNAPAGSRTRDRKLAIFRSQVRRPNHYTTVTCDSTKKTLSNVEDSAVQRWEFVLSYSDAESP